MTEHVGDWPALPLRLFLLFLARHSLNGSLDVRLGGPASEVNRSGGYWPLLILTLAAAVLLAYLFRAGLA